MKARLFVLSVLLNLFKILCTEMMYIDSFIVAYKTKKIQYVMFFTRVG